MSEHRSLGFSRVVLWLAALGTIPMATVSDDSPGMKRVSIVMGCLEVPSDAHVVLTESLVDAWVGYVELPGEKRHVWWLTGMWTDFLKANSEREISWVKTDDDSGFRYGVVRHRDKESLVLSYSSLLQFILPGGSEKDLELLFRINESHRSVDRSQCEGPVAKFRERAF